MPFTLGANSQLTSVQVPDHNCRNGLKLEELNPQSLQNEAPSIPFQYKFVDVTSEVPLSSATPEQVYRSVCQAYY